MPVKDHEPLVRETPTSQQQPHPLPDAAGIEQLFQEPDASTVPVDAQTHQEGSAKTVLDGPQGSLQLLSLLEGYLYGLGEACHTLFGPEGEVALYTAIGSLFLKYLKRSMGITFPEADPWERYKHIVAVFTSHGFYSHVELEALGPNAYWMLEADQYAGGVWEEQGAWARGTPPCPLWSIILYSLSEIGYTIVLDTVSFNSESDGYESTFHFERLPERADDVVAHARRVLQRSLVPICANCKQIRDDDGTWVGLELYLIKSNRVEFTHGICPACIETLYPELAEERKAERTLARQVADIADR